MKSLCVYFLFVLTLKFVDLEGLGSGANGNLRLCIVEGRGSYKRGAKYCPILDQEDSKVECVLGTDRLDCLRRISKGTVDFGVFSPEDLIAAQWADIDVLVTNELRDRHRQFERSVVAVVNRRLLGEAAAGAAGAAGAGAVLRGAALCLPGAGPDDLRPLSDTLSAYIESLVITRSCEPTLSLSENRIRAVAKFFGKSCKAGPWLPDAVRDAELKQRYPSLCAACASGACSRAERYRGAGGALACLAAGAGDALWALGDDVAAYFGLNGRKALGSTDSFAFLCRDGSFQPLSNNSDPCVWLQRPWPVVIAKRKAAESVSSLVTSLGEGSLTDSHWRGALTALLELRKPATEVRPARVPLDYLASAKGFREAYSQSGCDPPRHIALCTTYLLENNKCEWLSEAGAVYGVAPPLQCHMQSSIENCLAAVRDGVCDVVLASDMLVPAIRDYNVEPILYEATPIVEKMYTVVAYVRKDAMITKMADLRGKRAAFPRFDGTAWHSIMHYLKSKEGNCGDSINYFSEICAPGVEKFNISKTTDKFTKSCYKDGGRVLDGEILALKSLVDSKSDVAFISMDTFNEYKDKKINEEWASKPIEIVPVCPEENAEYCFISWSNIGHIFAAKNLTDMRRHEIINVFTKLDQLFGKQQPFRSAMFSMYGPFSHQLNVLFHNNTKGLATTDMLKLHPYATIPLNFEQSIVNGTLIDSCQLSDILKDSGVDATRAHMVLLAALVAYFLIS